MRREIHVPPVLRRAVRGLLLLTCWGLMAADLQAADDLLSELRVEERIEHSPRLLEYKLSTPALAEPTSVRILLPQHMTPEARYPVLYLLHGGVGDFRDWTRAGNVEQLTADLPLIVVMPDGGQVGWYTNWFNDGAGGHPQWETYHITQLIPWIDAEFPTVASRQGRALAGLSMGGFGAMSYAARHPDMFVATAAFSGFVDIANPQYAPLLQSMFPLLKAKANNIFGQYPQQTARWRARNPVDLAENLRGLTVVLRTGNGLTGPDNPRLDIVEYSVHATMKSLQSRLEELEIEHVWEDYGAAAHNFSHWQRSLEKTLPIFMETFAEPPAAPETINFVAAEPEFSVFDWYLKRPAAENSFIQLLNANRHGFELCGTGNISVTTPAGMFPAHAEVMATFQDGDRQTTSSVTADEHGRAVISVDLNGTHEERPTPHRIVIKLRAAAASEPVATLESAEN